MKFPITNKLTVSPGFINFFIMAIAFLGPFASNSYLASLPELGKHLASSNESMELTLTVFILSQGISQLIYGPLSDAFGRRQILLIGLFIALAGSVGCFFASNAKILIAFRFIQGAGIGASSTLSRSIQRDTFNGLDFFKAGARNGIIFSIAQFSAPMVGGYIDYWFGRNGNFVFIIWMVIIISLLVWLFLIETNKSIARDASKPKIIFHNYLFLMHNKIFMGYLLTAAFAISGTIVFNTLSPFLFQEVLGLSPVDYGLLSTLAISGIFIGRFINVLLLTWLRPTHISVCGMIIMLFSSVALLASGLWGDLNITVMIIPIVFYIIGASLVMTTAFAGALEPFPEIAGIAGALYGSLNMLIAFIFSAIVAVLRDYNQNLLAVTLLVTSLGSLWAFFGLIKKHRDTFIFQGGKKDVEIS